MKRFLSVLMCFVLIIGMAACNKDGGDLYTTENSSESPTYESNSTTAYVNNEDTTVSVTQPQTTIADVSQKETVKQTEAETTETTTEKSTTQKTPSTTKAMPTTAPTQRVTTTAPQIVPGTTNVTTTRGCSHKKTIIKNQAGATAGKDGYTGDTYCADCGVLIRIGEKIEYIEETVKDTTTETTQQNMVQYPCPDGSTITVPVGTNIFDYTMQKAGKTASHDFSEIENEVFRLFNEERARSGISAVSNNSDAYYYVKLRAAELQSSFSHTRPNGADFSGVYEDEGIVLCAMAENIVTINVPEDVDIAYEIFNSIMNSPSHKSAALNPIYNQMTVAIVCYEGQYYFCQHMYENVVH